MKTAVIFFLIFGQADGTDPWSSEGPGGLAVIPAHYESQISCEAAGEAARANNQGLSFLSYTCVPASQNVEAEGVKTLIESVSKGKMGLFALSHTPCKEVCGAPL